MEDNKDGLILRKFCLRVWIFRDWKVYGVVGSFNKYLKSMSVCYIHIESVLEYSIHIKVCLVFPVQYSE